MLHLERCSGVVGDTDSLPSDFNNFLDNDVKVIR